jgi:hypothetical protein
MKISKSNLLIPCKGYFWKNGIIILDMFSKFVTVIILLGEVDPPSVFNVPQFKYKIIKVKSSLSLSL